MTRFNDRRFVLAVSTGVLPSLALAQDLSHGESPDDSLQKLAVAHSHFSGMAAGTALFVVAIVAMALLFSFFREKRRQDLIARFVDKGVEIPPGLLPAGPSRQRELRRGTVLVALGLGLGVALYALGGLWMALWSVILLFLGAASFVNAMLFYPGDDPAALTSSRHTGMTDSEAALVARVVADDDRAAFELLVRRYQSPLRNFLRRLTRNDAARADDLAQETFIKVYRSIGTWRGQAKFQTWLYRIAYHTYLNDQRGRVPESAFEESHHAPGADTALAAGDEADVERAMLRLSDRQRAIFDLHHRKGLTHAEVADALELPLGTVKSDLSRGLELLRSIFGPREEA